MSSEIIPFKTNFPHHQHRRKRGHDYCDPWKYHITINKAPACPFFSSLEVKALTPEGVNLRYSSVGKILGKAISEIPSIEPKVQVYQYSIMPDHIHILIRVKERMERKLGMVIHDFKSNATSSIRRLLQIPDLEAFTPNFNDKIIFSHRSLDDVYSYIRHNPYRLAVRQRCPDFFRKSRRIFLKGRELQAFGNLFHLRNPFKYSLIIHRSDSDDVFTHKMEVCLYHAVNGGVVVSAFISPREKEIRRRIEESGGRIICLHHQPLEHREKPTRHDFDLCTQGRLLLISPLDYLSLQKTDRPTRKQCLDMNGLADHLALHGLDPIS